MRTHTKNVSIHLCIHTHTPKHTYTCARITRTRSCALAHAYTYTPRMHTCTHVQAHMHTYKSVKTNMHTRSYMYRCTCTRSAQSHTCPCCCMFTEEKKGLYRCFERDVHAGAHTCVFARKRLCTTHVHALVLTCKNTNNYKNICLPHHLKIDLTADWWQIIQLTHLNCS
jgi:hypothetical protein